MDEHTEITFRKDLTGNIQPIDPFLESLKQAYERRDVPEFTRINHHIGNLLKNPAEPESTRPGIWIKARSTVQDPILEGVFHKGQLVQTVAKSKRGKSFWVSQGALCLASGTNFLLWKIHRPYKVLWIDNELQKEFLAQRVYDQAKMLNITDTKTIDENLEILTFYYSIDEMTIDEYFNYIREKIKYTQPEVVFIDPIYSVGEGDENTSKDNRPLIKRLKQLIILGCAVVYVHHDAKGEAGDRDPSDRGSGHGILGRSWDAQISLTAHSCGSDDKSVMETTSRHHKSPEPVTLHFFSNDVKYGAKGEYGCFFLDDLPATKRTSKTKVSNELAIETYQESATDILKKSKPIPVSLFRNDIQTKLGLTQKRERLLVDFLTKNAVIAFYTQRKNGLNQKLVGLPEDIAALREAEQTQTEISLSPESVPEKKTNINIPDTDDDPFVAWVSGFLDTQEKGEWQGTAQNLFDLMPNPTEENKLPRTSAWITRALKSYRPKLTQQKIEFDLKKIHGLKILTLRKKSSGCR